MRAELAAKLAWIAAGLTIAWLARELGIGKPQEPGPGMLAFGLGLLMAGVAAGGAILLCIRINGTENPNFRGAPRVAGLCIGLLVYIAALVPLGFPLATFLFLAALLGVFAELSWPRALLISALASGASYALFKFGLGTQLPAGILG